MARPSTSIDGLERNRSPFIAEAAEHELARRHREALLSSVRNPHPETVDLADAGLEGWTADLPTSLSYANARRSSSRLFGTAVSGDSLPSISSDTQPLKPAFFRIFAIRG